MIFSMAKNNYSNLHDSYDNNELKDIITINNDNLKYCNENKVNEILKMLYDEIMAEKPINIYGCIINRIEKVSCKNRLNKNVIFIVGPPGSGKGTLCQKLIKDNKFIHYSVGELLRNASNEKTTLGESIRKCLDSGNLVTTYIIIGILRKELEKCDNNKTILLDGFPRDLKQALDFERELCNCKFCLYLTCSEQLSIKRILKRVTNTPLDLKRTDDVKETILHRLDVFREQTYPVIKYYETKYKLRIINGETSVDETYNDTLTLFKNN